MKKKFFLSQSNFKRQYRVVKHLTMKLKQEYFPLILERDGGFKCFYCKMPLKLSKFVYDHLNDNRSDNRVENVVFACYSCNNKKPVDGNMYDNAQEKLRQNEDLGFMREKIFLSDTNSVPSTEIEINTSNYDITEQYLGEIIQTDGKILYSDALNSCVYLCKKKIGHGSQQSVRNYIATLSSAVGPFMLIKDENGKKIIVKRFGN